MIVISGVGSLPLATYNNYMNPDMQQPIVTPSYTPYTTPEPPQGNTGKKKLMLIIAGIVVLVAGSVAAFFLLRPDAKPANKETSSGKAGTGSPVTFSKADRAVTYAGNAMYDACNFLPVSILQKHTGEFDKSYKSLASGFRLKDPLVIDHGYYDRDISAIIGKDGTAREPGTLITETSNSNAIRASSFMSIGDSYCMYGQGQNFNSSLAKVYVLQPPKPIHPSLAGYLAELKKGGQLAEVIQGVEVYIETPKEGDDAIAAMFKKGNVIVFMSSRNADLLQAAIEPVVDGLNKPPAGRMLAKFPDAYSKTINTCDLLPASDFQRLFGKPASALTSEFINLTESEPYTSYRECSRIEDERLKEGEISSARIQLTESQTEKQTKQRITTIKEDTNNKLTPIKDLGDEAYAVTTTLAGTRRQMIVRVGKVLFTIKTEGEVKDASDESFIARTVPVAKTVVANYKR